MPDRQSTQRSPARNPLPEGTVAVAMGLVVSGAAAYLFLKLARAGLGTDERASPINQLWFMTFLLAPGFFLPVEQEVGRALAHRRALGQGGGPVIRRASLLALMLAGATTVLLAAISPLVVHRLFDGHWLLFGCLVLAFLSYASAHLARGVFSGSGRFNSYGIVMGADGVVRVLACTLLAGFGVKALGLYGLAVGVPPMIAVFLALRGQEGLLPPGPEADWRELTPNLGWLVLGSVMGAVLVNAGPIAAGLLKKPDQKALVNHFTYAVLITRVPLFMFQAVQAALLPKLARLAARGAFDEFRTGFRKLLILVIAVGIIGVGGALVFGPFAVKLFSKDADVSRQTVGMLALASALYMVGLAMAQAVIALRGHARVAGGWAMGVAALVIVTAVAGHDLLLRVESGLVAGCSVATVAFAFALRSRLRAGIVPDEDSLTEAMLDLKLEP